MEKSNGEGWKGMPSQIWRDVYARLRSLDLTQLFLNFLEALNRWLNFIRKVLLSCTFYHKKYDSLLISYRWVIIVLFTNFKISHHLLTFKSTLHFFFKVTFLGMTQNVGTHFQNRFIQICRTTRIICRIKTVNFRTYT